MTDRNVKYIIFRSVVYSISIGGVVALITTVYQVVRGGYIIDGFLSACNYFAVNGIANVIVYLILTVCLTAVGILINLLRKRGAVLSRRVFGGINGFSAAFVFSCIVIKIVNTEYLPEFFSNASLVANGVMVLIIPIFIGSTVYLFAKAGPFFDRKLAYYTCLAFGVCSIVVTLVGIFAFSEAYVPDYPDIEDGPNVIIITMDAYRRDHMSCYNPESVRTPIYDSFARKGFLFENSYSNNPWTIPSLMTMNTGHYPSVHKADIFTAAPPGIITLAQTLKGHGYRTEAYVGNPILYSEYGFKRGYDVYLEYGDLGGGAFFKKAVIYGFFKRLADVYRSRFSVGRDSTEWCKSHLIDCVRRNYGKRPFFVWVHFLDPHTPLTPPAEYIEGDGAFVEKAVAFGLTRTQDGQYFEEGYLPLYRELYNAEVRYLDESMGEIFGVFDELSVWDDSLVIISADHGEAFFEHGYYGHGRSHYYAEVAVPLVIYLPGEEGGKVVNVPASVIDIPVTVLDYVGAEPLPGSFGKSLLPYLSGEEDEEVRLFYDGIADNKNIFSVYDGRYHLIRYGSGEYKYELYDTIEDRFELNDIANDPSYEGVKDRLTEDLSAMAGRLKATSEGFEGAKTVTLDAERRKKLKGLGYLK